MFLREDKPSNHAQIHFPSGPNSLCDTLWTSFAYCGAIGLADRGGKGIAGDVTQIFSPTKDGQIHTFPVWLGLVIYMGVSKNSGTPNHPFL